MAHKRNKAVQFLMFFACLVFFRIVGLMPLSVARKFGGGLAFLAYHLVPRIKKIGLANLDIAYGDRLTREEKEAILKGSVRNLATVAVEFPHIPSLPGRLPRMNIVIKGFECVDRSAGGILVGAHMGNWEWLLPIGAHLGLEVIAVAREFDDPRMNAFIDGVRRTSGIKTIPKDAAMRPLLHKIHEGTYAGLLADQNPRENAVPVHFFGTRTWATIGPAIMAMRSQTPIHPICITRNADGDYTVELFPALPLEDTGDTLSDLQTNTQRCQDALEAMIRKHPEQWLWFHRRWRKRERLEREWEERLAKREQEKAAQT